jgi:energy-coupling factor transporter ATP-binding protein EcfA2
MILENGTKRYSGNLVPAANHLSMPAHNQECLVLVGPAGCGESTAMRTVVGLGRFPPPLPRRPAGDEKVATTRPAGRTRHEQTS